MGKGDLTTVQISKMYKARLDAICRVEHRTPPAQIEHWIDNYPAVQDVVEKQADLTAAEKKDSTDLK